jgi:hypothetical protein
MNARRRNSRWTSISDHSGCPCRMPSLANSRVKRLISSANRRRCSPVIARCTRSCTACAGGLVSVTGTVQMLASTKRDPPSSAWVLARPSGTRATTRRRGGCCQARGFLRLVPVATAFRRATLQPKRDRSIVELVDKSNPATLPILIYDSIRSPRSLTATRFVGRNATPT